MLSLDNFYGQKHVLDVVSPMLENSKFFSMIFYGPSGCGKTTLANIICKQSNLPHKFFNAAINNKADLTAIIKESTNHEIFIVIIDEFHRLNKDKQDILLPYLEQKNFVVFGLTTSNPYHSINPAIRSRMIITEFHKLTNDDIYKYFKQANHLIEDDVIELIVNSANGDMRYVLNHLEVLELLANNKVINMEVYKKLHSSKSLSIDKNSDYYYDLLSAFQKSIRGSDVNAALLYLSALLDLGDLDIICRRLLVIGYEDIGLANPNLASRVLNAINTALIIGLPEARHPLSNIVIELALSPKSNAAYLSLLNATNNLSNFEIPKNICAHPKNYLYPHDYNGWVAQQYLPDLKKSQEYLVLKNSKNELELKKVYDKILYLQKKN